VMHYTNRLTEAAIQFAVTSGCAGIRATPQLGEKSAGLAVRVRVRLGFKFFSHFRQILVAPVTVTQPNDDWRGLHMLKCYCSND